MTYRTGALILAGCIAALAACSSAAPPKPENVRVGGSAPKHVAASLPGASAPEIQSIWFNSLDVSRGGTWEGRIDTSTNVASVEIRNNLFSINARRASFGHFRFAVDVFDVPAIFIRGYDLRVIARNAAGTEAEEDLPFQIR
ncbi:MAG TPA: hypothetical protein VGN11_07150 [Candidatus Baltobacteraceae bacterium]|jgi:hypothetical protein|nr:hypothetical protein [Candidatus Baltobacteraceae bacterium]